MSLFPLDKIKPEKEEEGRYYNSHYFNYDGQQQVRLEYRFPKCSLTADCVVFGFDGKDLHILLIERGIEAFKGMWALPGGFMNPNETIEECAERELWEETKVCDVYKEQFGVFSAIDRDPRCRVVTVGFVALVRKSGFEVIGGSDAKKAQWFKEDELPPLAFDHEEIVKAARNHLKERMRIEPIAFNLLNEKFSISELQQVYEAIKGENYDRRNFYRKMISSGYLQNEGKSEEPTPNRRPDLFSFDTKQFKEDETDNPSQTDSLLF